MSPLDDQYVGARFLAGLQTPDRFVEIGIAMQESLSACS